MLGIEHPLVFKRIRHWVGGTVPRGLVDLLTEFSEVTLTDVNIAILAGKYDLMIIEHDGILSLFLDDKGQHFRTR